MNSSWRPVVQFVHWEISNNFRLGGRISVPCLHDFPQSLHEISGIVYQLKRFLYVVGYQFMHSVESKSTFRKNKSPLWLTSNGLHCYLIATRLGTLHRTPCSIYNNFTTVIHGITKVKQNIHHLIWKTTT